MGIVLEEETVTKNLFFLLCCEVRPSNLLTFFLDARHGWEVKTLP